MKTTSVLIEVLDRTPTVLQHLISQIPADRLHTRTTQSQWGVKEWLCHWIDAQDVLMDRFTRFETEEDPLIADYEPPPPSDPRYRDRDFAEAVIRFTDLRAINVRRLRRYDEAFWSRLGRHESYRPYGTKILLGHMLNVDYTHLFSMEKTGLAAATAPD